MDANASANGDNPPPDDFRDPFYLRHCYVCKMEAKPGQEFICNYGGGVACFGCRAFWRRAHLKSRWPVLVCKGNRDDVGRCDLTLRAKRKCQKCRYDLCKKIGMTSSAILTEEQKKARFRKSLQRKGQPPRDDDSDAFSGDHSSEAMTPFPHQPEEEKIDPPQTEGVQKFDENSKSYQIIHRKTEMITQSYNAALLEASSTVFNDLISAWKNLASSEDLLAFKVPDFREIFSALQREFQIFAFKLRYFRKLDPRDQEMLLKRNTPLYVHLQLAWTLSTLSCDTTTWPSNIALEKLEVLKTIFLSEFDVVEYLKLVRQIQGILTPDEGNQRALLSYIVLFDFDTSTTMFSLELMEDLIILTTILFENKIQRTDTDLSVTSFSQTLNKMFKLCGSVDLCAVSRFGGKVNYSESEEHWLQQQYRKYDDEFFSLDVGENLLYEYFMFSLGEPVSKRYFVSYTSLVKERMKRILKMHPELENLTSSLQDVVIQRNTLLGVALILTRSENFSNAQQQLQFGLTFKDNNWWKTNFGHLFDDTKSILKVSLTQSSALSKEQVETYRHVSRVVREAVLDQDLFRLRVLIALTKPLEQDSTSSLCILHNNYLSIFQRRLEWVGNKETSDEKWTKTMNDFEQLKIVSEIVSHAFSN